MVQLRLSVPPSPSTRALAVRRADGKAASLRRLWARPAHRSIPLESNHRRRHPRPPSRRPRRPAPLPRRLWARPAHRSIPLASHHRRRHPRPCCSSRISVLVYLFHDDRRVSAIVPSRLPAFVAICTIDCRCLHVHAWARPAFAVPGARAPVSIIVPSHAPGHQPHPLSLRLPAPRISSSTRSPFPRSSSRTSTHNFSCLLHLRPRRLGARLEHRARVTLAGTLSSTRTVFGQRKLERRDF